MKYYARARRSTGGWVIHVEHVGVTNARKLTDAVVAAQLCIELETGERGAFVSLTVELDDDVRAQLDEARAATAAAAAATRAAAVLLRRAAHSLRAAKFTAREAAIVLEVSQQRVSQLWAESVHFSLDAYGGMPACRGEDGPWTDDPSQVTCAACATVAAA